MRKHSELKKYQDILMENGVAHIIYPASDVQDIIHPFSPEGKELLSVNFLEFLEKYRAVIPRKVPVVLEITGASFSKEEKDLIDITIWDHFCMNMTAADNEAKKCIKRAVLYLFYTVLSAVLIFAAAAVNGDVFSNFAYMVFWFFGYRLLIYLLIDSMPLWKNRSWYRQLASVKLIFSKSGVTDLAKLDADKISEEVSQYSHETYDEIKDNYMILEHIRDRGIEQLQCKVDCIEDLISMPGVKGREYISDSLAGYIGQLECFFDENCDMTLNIKGKTFTEEEQGRIQNAIRNYYGFRIAEEEVFSSDNLQQILLFGISVVISAVMLAAFGNIVDAASSEFICMMFWFFGDYFLEFILIIHFDIKKARKILESCRDMKLIF